MQVFPQFAEGLFSALALHWALALLFSWMASLALIGVAVGAAAFAARAGVRVSITITASLVLFCLSLVLVAHEALVGAPQRLSGATKVCPRLCVLLL